MCSPGNFKNAKIKEIVRKKIHFRFRTDECLKKAILGSRMISDVRYVKTTSFPYIIGNNDTVKRGERERPLIIHHFE
jgi:hypothetical protein